MRLTLNAGTIVLSVILLSLLSLAASCGGDNEETPAAIVQPTDTEGFASPESRTAGLVEPEISESSSTSEANVDFGTLVYNMYYEYEDATEDTVWTATTIGKETIDGIGCYVIEHSFDAKPQRSRFVPQLDSDMDIVTQSDLIWLDAATLQPVKGERSTTQIGMTISTAITFDYESDHGAPFTEGQTWAYTIIAAPQLGAPEISMWNAEVVGNEEIVVPAGTFACYKVVHTNDMGLARTEWWAIDGAYPTAIKAIDEANWHGVETRELVSFAPSDSTVQLVTPESATAPVPEPTVTPGPFEPFDVSGPVSVYDVHYEREDTIEDTTWTRSMIGTQEVAGVECYVIEIAYDVNPERPFYLADSDTEIPLTLTGANSWIDNETLMPIKTVSSVSSFGVDSSATTKWMYDSPCGAPFSIGKEWSSEVTVTPDIGNPIVYTLDAKVVEMEEVTVPAGMFECYKLVYSVDSVTTSTEWWPADDNYPIAVKIVSQDGTETHDLVFYTE